MEGGGVQCDTPQGWVPSSDAYSLGEIIHQVSCEETEVGPISLEGRGR